MLSTPPLVSLVLLLLLVLSVRAAQCMWVMENVSHVLVVLCLTVLLKQRVCHAQRDILQRKERVDVSYAHLINIPMRVRVVVPAVGRDHR